MSKMSFVTLRGKQYKVKKSILSLINRGIESIDEIVGLESLPNIISLNLSNNNITEIRGLEDLPNLVNLNLSNNNITEIKGLENLSNLFDLDLSGNAITEIKGLGYQGKLRFLKLNKNKISEIKGLDSLTDLMVLNLERNLIGEIKGLDNLSKINALYLANNNITEVKNIEHLRNLKRFDLGTTAKISREQVKQVQKAGIHTEDQRYWQKKTMWKIIGFFIAVAIGDLILSVSIVVGAQWDAGAFLPLYGGLFFPCMILGPFLYCAARAYSGY